ncbi:hypothetical protein AB0N05_38780 [Nocardia sp. NPDC051030]|uniref:hypothetical protein n=1 Tax=Nocardia sp. NPDC051030 TaxID=3155162 RepID=UPI0034147B5A
MTSSNPGPGGPEDPARHQETAQWWATAPTGNDQGQPVTGTDPTMLNYSNGGMPPYTPPAQQVPPQQPMNTYPPQPQVGAPYGAPQQPYTAPPQQQFAQPAQQFAQPQAPMQGGYGYPTPPRPPSSGSKAGWIIGGVIGLVVIVGIGIGVIALSGSDSPASPLGGDDKKKNMDGNYSMDSVTNACTLIDPTVLTKWSSTSKGSPTHTETKPTDYSGGRLECSAGYSGQSSTSKYHTNEADITLDVSFNSAYGKPEYESWKQYDTGTTGSGRSSGDVTGIGSQGYWHAETSDYSSFAVLDYTVGVQDSNVSVKVKVSIDRGQGETVSKEEVASIAKDQAQKALTALKKK